MSFWVAELLVSAHRDSHAAHCTAASMPCKPCAVLLLAAHAAALQPPSWSALSKTLPSASREVPTIFDAVHHRQTKPKLSDETVVLYRERNGWCPYSERVWLGLECKNVEYQTVLIDNTGGARPGGAAVSRRAAVPRRLDAIDATRFQE